ncbi:MAG: hypothetical protein P8P66_15070 [Paracoccaceae bacterium]|nr:hypothetical protein [Paracoccaceae bacterium]
MFNPIHLLRISKWARHPPAMWRLKLIVGIIIFCAIIFVIERYIGWPDALSVEPRRPRIKTF